MLLFLLAVIIFWSLVHAFHKRQEILPFHRPRSSWNVSLDRVHLKFETRAWNNAIPRLPSFTRAYDLGIFFGALGMLAGYGLMFWMAYQSFPEPQVSHVKRDFVDKTSASLKPIIPGVTVPFNHLPIILLAVFLSQAIHELGHALAAVIERVPIQSLGISLFLVIPSAFVSLSSLSMDDIKPRQKARIIATGPWHNLLFYLFLVACAKIGLNAENAVKVGYKDVSETGRVVIGIDADSPLNEVLRVGNIITMLDDVPIGGKEDNWSLFLLDPSFELTPLTGWCTSENVFDNASRSCCTPSTSTRSIYACFSSDRDQARACLDPLAVFTNPANRRCHSSSSSDCLCVLPDPDLTSLLRLTLSTGEILLWDGPREEIYQQVKLGTLLPRVPILFPVFLPEVAVLFQSYLTLATLSLYIFNLLPFPMLDGAHLLGAFLNWTHHSDSQVDLEGGYSLGAGRKTKRDKIRRAVELATVLMALCCLGVAVLNGLTEIRK